MLATLYPCPLADRVLSVLFQNKRVVDRLAIVPTFAIGSVLLLSRGVMRKIRYNTMGKPCAFQLAVLKAHKLIKIGAVRCGPSPGLRLVHLRDCREFHDSTSAGIIA